MATVYLGVGSNLGDRQANIDRAIALLKEHEDIEVLAVSSFIESDPEGGPPQGPYLNGALRLKTDLLPLDLLSQLKMVERRLGRQKGAPNSPRPIDLDILLYDDRILREPNLTVPHPHLHERGFVLEPLAQLAPELVHPVLHETIAVLRDRAPVRLAGSEQTAGSAPSS